MAQYATLRAAAVLRAPGSNFTAAQLSSYIVQLGVYARRDPLLIPVYLAIAAEDGIVGPVGAPV
jgi:hypothetical protein